MILVSKVTSPYIGVAIFYLDKYCLLTLLFADYQAVHEGYAIGLLPNTMT